MRILVCGHREFNDVPLLEGILDDLKPTTIIEGEARGADTLSRLYGERRGIPVLRFPADWNKYGNAAGPIRNKQMLTEGKPDLVVAFLSKDSKGTKDMIKQAKDYGTKVEVIHI